MSILAPTGKTHARRALVRFRLIGAATVLAALVCFVALVERSVGSSHTAQDDREHEAHRRSLRDDEPRLRRLQAELDRDEQDPEHAKTEAEIASLIAHHDPPVKDLTNVNVACRLHQCVALLTFAPGSERTTVDALVRADGALYGKFARFEYVRKRDNEASSRLFITRQPQG